jgi:hypothetical protein
MPYSTEVGLHKKGKARERVHAIVVMYFWHLLPVIMLPIISDEKASASIRRRG